MPSPRSGTIFSFITKNPDFLRKNKKVFGIIPIHITYKFCTRRDMSRLVQGLYLYQVFCEMVLVLFTSKGF
jgi:hypothetical protein